MRGFATIQRDEGMVSDTNVPDKDLWTPDGGLLDSIFNKWLCKASPTRSIVLDRQREMNEEKAENNPFASMLSGVTSQIEDASAQKK
eukprot:CAMPEP_0167752204 /NCGR_PEP_ID=MMETSP0110_2-20121227/7003_1 /TAXON_ID=629695 /ORGANISM="Gymnochlora sp., Strain CCMP2014" /LENGTH=86 /DNA_ID=CAMNT_0007637783 /DNA_START=195 /DNA_END=455 /DNA_ORIENTATION=+